VICLNDLRQTTLRGEKSGTGVNVTLCVSVCECLCACVWPVDGKLRDLTSYLDQDSSVTITRELQPNNGISGSSESGYVKKYLKINQERLEYSDVMSGL